MKDQGKLHGGAMLEAVFAPLDPQTFATEYWQKEALVLGNRRTGHFDDILSVDDIDSIVANCSIPEGNIDMGTNAMGAPPEKYKRYGYADAVSVAQRHREGETIILRSMHLFNSGLRDVCSALSCVFRCPAQANLYLTPAGTRSSYPHWDAHDIIVLQLAGTKTWTLHENQIRLPHPAFRFDPERHPIGAENGELVLRPGDTAYIPRGLAHNPYANEYSVHVSIGVQVLTMYDVLAHALDRLVNTDAAMRGAVPVLQNGSGLEQETFDSQFRELLGSTLTADTVADAARELLDRATARTPRTCTKNVLTTARQPIQIGLNTRVCMPSRLPSRHTSQFGDKVRVLMNGTEFEVSFTHAEMANFLIEQRRCRVVDLPGVDSVVKLAFVQHLIDEGCLRIEDDECISAPPASSASLEVPNTAFTQ